MKILYVQPGQGVGGSKISLRHILQSAPVDQVSQVALSSPPDRDYEQTISPFIERIHYLDLPTWHKYRRSLWQQRVIAPLSHVRRLLSLVPSVLKLMGVIRTEQVDIVHTNNSLCPAGAFAARLAGVPHIWHVREPIGVMGEYPLIIGDRLSEFVFQKFSSSIICISAYTADFFVNRNISVNIVRNGVYIDRFQTDDAKRGGKALRQSLFGENDSPVIGMIGNITTQWKNHKLFLDVSAKLQVEFPKCRFVVFGGSSNLNITPYTKDLRRISTKLGLENNLIWAEFVDDIPSIMNSIDILVHPVSKEGSGRVVMEAMAAGRVVVGVKSGGVQELIQHGVTGYLVEPENCDEIVEKVRFLVQNPKERLRIAQQAAGFAKVNFSNISTVASLSKIYDTVFESK